MVWSKIGGGRNGVSAGDFLDRKQQATVFQDLVAFTGNSFNLATKDSPGTDSGAVTASSSWFRDAWANRCFLGAGYPPGWDRGPGAGKKSM